jgi:hypothetical protein
VTPGHRPLAVRTGAQRSETGPEPVQVLFPQGWERFELVASGWSRVLGIDAVGGPPDCDFANEAAARVTSRRCPDWRAVTSVGVVLDLVGEVGDQSRSLGQVDPPDVMGMDRFWNVREPGKRAWVDRRELWEAPVASGGQVAGRVEVASGGQVAGRVDAANASRWARRVGQVDSAVSPGM